MGTYSLTLSESQLDELRYLNAIDYSFPSVGRVRSCKKLEKIGLADSKKLLFRHSFINGRWLAECKLAYKLTPDGLKWQNVFR